MPEKEIIAAAAQCGMIVVDDVMDKDGRVLIARGVRLTPIYVNHLVKCGVKSIVVEEAPPAPASDAMPLPSTSDFDTPKDQSTFIQVTRAVLSARFAKVENNPLMMQLRHAALQRLIALGPNGVPGGFPDGVKSIPEVTVSDVSGVR